MENKELETWLKATKAKNLSKEDLKKVTNNLDSVFYNKLRKELKVGGTLYEHLFNQWQKEAEFSPKIIGYKAPFDLFRGTIKKGSIFPPSEHNTSVYNKYGVPIEVVETWEAVYEAPTEQPTETDFKSKVIELIEGKINATTAALETIIGIQKDLLEQVKNLC